MSHRKLRGKEGVDGVCGGTYVNGHVVPRHVVGQARQLRAVGVEEPATQDIVRVVVDGRFACVVAAESVAFVGIDMDDGVALLFEACDALGEGPTVLSFF